MIIEEVFEKRQTIITYTVEELKKMVANGQLTLRNTNKGQVLQLRHYLLDNIVSGQIFLPPIVAMLKDGTLEDGKPEELIVIDGTQRMKALTEMQTTITKLMNSEDSTEQRKGFKLLYTLNSVEIAIQVFEGLTQAEADQLYIDLNTKGKKVSLSKRIAYDSRNEINQMTNRLLASNDLLRKAGVEQEKISVVRPRNKNLLSLSQLRRIVGYFMTGKSMNSKLTMNDEYNLHPEENLELITTWFEELFALYPAERIGDYDHSMLASFTLLSALIHYSFDGLQENSFVEKKEVIQQRMKRLTHLDWSRDQEKWFEFEGSTRGKSKYYYLANDKNTTMALVDWLRFEGGD